MTQIVLPYRPVAGDPEDVSQIMADFDAVLAVVNGGLKDDNIAADAAIAATKLAAIPGSRIQFSRGVTPPGSPADGDLWQLAADAANGVYWLFRYNAGGGTNKWEFIGGSPLVAQVAANEALATAGVYAALTTAGPSVTLPRAGDYVVQHSCVYGSDAAGAYHNMSYDIGATAAADADSLGVGAGLWLSAVNVINQASRLQVKTGLTAVTLTCKYKKQGGATASFGLRMINVLPVRVS